MSDAPAGIFTRVEPGGDVDAAALEDDMIELERRSAPFSRPTGTPVSDPLKIGVLISGSGTNLQALIDRIDRGDLNARIVLVVSSRGDAGGLKRAARSGIQTLALSKEIYDADPWDADEVIATEMRRLEAEYIIMAGYMRRVHEPLLALWPNRIVNIHPALLPSFPGAHAIAEAYARGVKVSGVTVHFANADYDQGPIIAQEPVRIRQDMDLEAFEAAIHEVEHRLYPDTVQLLAEGRVHVRGDLTVAIDPR
ncbi:formyltetrahydrofolate-dependent phosphoribosylglycinamide formyltransferase [Coriobacterium glomerans PW2]|uniref:Phosphoribosylglycinamide formyltransferase n=1 Tax=Coriobacterium glomerans (strain ATCC 49209 / DSM 20642 / JCM 10262 / PW2) TaxID=700015 RepID=F2N9A2_CORGP|nr:phosphoribosylglycinamide formyltransferase [Coriobacterium glomerans]AEB07850.1 formyltetrahydrofolate-dependent phosphoribosylglycinamide formyltransferase [Coriobacterium glomerans PW2]